MSHNANLTSQNVRDKVNIGGVVGSYAPPILNSEFRLNDLDYDQRQIPGKSSKTISYNAGKNIKALIARVPGGGGFLFVGELPWSGYFTVITDVRLEKITLSGTTINFTFYNLYENSRYADGIFNLLHFD